jgi:hypothetical protein
MQIDLYRKEKSKTKKKVAYDEAVDEYYTLKSNYEEEIQKNKKEILNNPRLSKREKRMEYLKLKPKCVVCQRPVGSIFKNVVVSSQENGTEGATDEGSKLKTRNLIALCGDRENPCSLKITLNSGDIVSISDGAFNGFNGVISSVKGDKVDVEVKIFGRGTIVTVGIEHVEKV